PLATFLSEFADRFADSNCAGCGARSVGQAATVGDQPSKGVAMKRFACLVLTLGSVLVAANSARADWLGSAHYGGYQPWWNIFAHRPCLTCEEERLQRFWHDYYDALRRYYGMLDHMDWVSYYKNHGYQINTGCGGPGCGGPCGGSTRIQFAPVFVS